MSYEPKTLPTGIAEAIRQSQRWRSAQTWTGPLLTTGLMADVRKTVTFFARVYPRGKGTVSVLSEKGRGRGQGLFRLLRPHRRRDFSHTPRGAGGAGTPLGARDLSHRLAAVTSFRRRSNTRSFSPSFMIRPNSKRATKVQTAEPPTAKSC